MRSRRRSRRQRREQVAEEEGREHEKGERRAEGPVPDAGQRRLDPYAEQGAVGPSDELGVT